MLCLAGLPDVKAQLSIGLSATEYNGGQFHVSDHGATDGGITATVSGGAGPYSYQWSTGGTMATVSGLGAGWYQVVVTDSTGLSDSAAVTLTEPALLMLMVQVTHPACADVANGSATLTVTGGVTPYTYMWSNGDTLSSTTGLGVGQHYVKVTSAGGAQRTEYFAVNAPMALMADVMQTGWPVCQGDTVTMTVNAWGGMPPYSYHWSTGTFNQQMKTVQGGQYAVQVTDMNNCHTTDSLWVTVPQGVTATINYLPYANGTPFSCDTCNDGVLQVTVSGGMEPYTAAWSTGHTGTVLNGMYADSAYHVTVTDMMGCKWYSDTIVAPRGVAFEQPLGVFLFAHQYAGGHHVSHAGAMDGSMEAVVVGGTPPYTMVWNTGDTVAELDSLPAGYYTVTVTDQSGAQRTRSKMLTAPMPLSVSLTGGLGGCMAVGNQLNAFVNGGAPPYTYTWWRNDSVYDGTHNFPYLYIQQAGTYRVEVADANADTVSTFTMIAATAPLTAEITATEVLPGYHALCHGDTVQLTLTVSGGSGPYMSLWEHGSFSQQPKVTDGGWKVVRVNDMQGCTVVDSFMVHIPKKLENRIHPYVYANGQAFSCDTCNDGRFVLDSIFGGVPPYSHLWSDGSTGDTLHGIIPDTLYSITMTDALGCTTTAGGSLPRTWNPQPPGLALMYDRSQFAGGYNVSCATCMDGWIQLWPSGGTPPYTFQWMDGDSAQSRYGLMAGTYSVTVTDAQGQTLWKDFTLLGPGGGWSVHISNNAGVCNGMVQGSLQTSVMGGVPPYMYQWERDGMVLPEMWDYVNVWQTGAYRVRVTDMNGQTATDSVQVSAGAGLMLTAGAVEKYGSAHTGCTVADGELVLHLSGGMPPYNVNVYGKGNQQGSMDGSSDFQHWLSTMDTVAVVDSLPAGYYSISVNDMGGCQTQREVELRSPVGYMVTATPVEMQGGQYASCDTCSDVTVNAATLGAWGAVQYAWAEVPAEQTPFRLRGASLSISEGGGNMDSGLFNGSDPSVFGTGAQQTGLMTETMYMVATMDELGCMGQVMFTVERPRAEQAAVPAWGLHGNDSTGAALDGDGAPWLGTSDSTDVVMKANGVPQLRLGADGVTSMEGQLRLAQVPNSLAEARLLMLNPDGSIGAYESAPGVSWPPPVSDGSCYGDGLDGPMQGVWDPGINKLTTCPQINVGIGVENPQYKLHVKDNARITGNLISSSMNSTRLNLDSDVNSASTGNRLYIKASAGTDAALIDNPDGNPILRILKDGNIGVGTSSPQARLDVRDAEGNAALRVYNDGKVVAGAPLLGQGDEALLYIGDENHYIRSLFDKGLSLSTAGADDALVIDDWSGKVNIGGRYTGSVPLSGYKLSVNGTIVGKEFYVTADPWNIDPWPDFVFNKGYELRPLDELQRFINEQGHLPEMPTAEEVETQGVGMARMSTLLLQKVEELTLYMLQMDKRMKELEEENSRLKERLTIND